MTESEIYELWSEKCDRYYEADSTYREALGQSITLYKDGLAKISNIHQLSLINKVESLGKEVDRIRDEMNYLINQLKDL